MELGTGGMAPRPTTLNLPNSLNVKEKDSLTSRTDNSFQEFDLKPCVAEQSEPRYPNEIKERRTSSGSKNNPNSLPREDACLRRIYEQETKQCEQPVCRDCCKSLRVMENKLENLSTCLERLETKLSADVESIFELLRARRRQNDFHTQV